MEKMIIDSFMCEKHTEQKRSIMTNNLLINSVAYQRIFVVRDSKIGVFRQDESSKVKFINKIPEISTLDGEVFSPDKCILHTTDTNMLMTNPKQLNTLYQMDLVRGEVVEEWDSEEMKLRNIHPRTKYSHASHDPTFYGLNANSIFVFDPRLPDPIVQKIEYQTPKNFTCMATDYNGRVITGNNKGEIRFYPTISHRA